MSMTIDIPEDILRLAMQAAGTQSPQEAVLMALEEYARRRRQAELIPLLGTFDEMMSLEELEKMRREQ